MVMQSLRNGASNGFLKYILFGLLGMAVGGLVMMDVRGVFTGGGGVSSTDVAKVGDKTIDVRDFDRSVRNSLSRYNIPVEQAYQLGLIDELLTGEIRKKYLLIEAEEMGIEIGNKELSQKIASIVKPQMQEGDTLQEALNRLLRMQGMSERDLLNAVKEESAGMLVMNALRSGFDSSIDMLAREMYSFQKQTRDIELISFDNSEIQNIPEPTEEQLTRLYNSLKNVNYKIPEYRTVQYALINPDDITIDISIDEDELKKAYKKNIDEYKLGEQFVLTQALVGDAETAEKIYQEVQDGIDLKDATISVMGDTNRFYENSSFEVEMMLPALYDALKDREIGKVVPPVKTALGHHVVKISKILPPSTKSFNVVKYSIEKELGQIKRADALYSIISEIEEKLIDGASLEEAIAMPAVEEHANIDQLSSVNIYGKTKEGDFALEPFEEQDRTQIIETVFEMKEDEPSLVYELPSSHFVAFEIKDIQSENFQPLEDVKEDIKQQFIADQQAAENRLRVEKFLAELETGGTSFKALAQSKDKDIIALNDINMEKEIPAPLTDATRPQIFKAPYMGYDMLELDGQYAIIHVTDATFPEVSDPPTDAQKVALESIRTQLAEESDSEVFLSYISYLNQNIDTKVNRALIDQVYDKSRANN